MVKKIIIAGLLLQGLFTFSKEPVDIKALERNLAVDFYNDLIFFCMNDKNFVEMKKVIHRYPRIVKIALGRGLETLLHAALAGNCMREAKYLLQAGADVNAQGTNDQTPLIMGIDFSADYELLEFISQQNYQLDIVDKYNWTALMWATYEEREHLVDHLVSIGASLNIIGYKNRTALDLAKGNKNIETRLRNSGAKKAIELPVSAL